jgi:hypothetical protein
MKPNLYPNLYPNALRWLFSLCVVLLLTLAITYKLSAQCTNTVNAATLDNANADPFTYTGLPTSATITIENTTDNVFNVTTNSGYVLGGSTAADRVYKITFSEPMSCVTLYFQGMDETFNPAWTNLQPNTEYKCLDFRLYFSRLNAVGTFYTRGKAIS